MTEQELRLFIVRGIGYGAEPEDQVLRHFAAFCQKYLQPGGEKPKPPEESGKK